MHSFHRLVVSSLLLAICLQSILAVNAEEQIAPEVTQKPTHKALPTVRILEVDMEREMKSARLAIERCYRKSLQYDPKLQGKIRVELKVDREQRVEKVIIIESDLDKSFHHKCVIPHLRGIQFKEKGLSSITFTFSIIFAL